MGGFLGADEPPVTRQRRTSTTPDAPNHATLTPLAFLVATTSREDHPTYRATSFATSIVLAFPPMS